MKALIFKSSIGLLGISGITGGGLLLNKYLNGKNVETKLKENKYELLTNDQTNDGKWAEILESYKQSNQKFDNFTGNENNAKSILQRRCQTALASYDENDYKKATKWCVEPVSVSDLLVKRGFKALKTGSDTNTDNTRWKNKVKEHKTESNGTLKFSDIVLTSDKTQATVQDLQNLKAKCDGIKSKKTHEADFETFIKQYETWCSYK